MLDPGNPRSTTLEEDSEFKAFAKSFLQAVGKSTDQLASEYNHFQLRDQEHRARYANFPNQAKNFLAEFKTLFCLKEMLEAFATSEASCERSFQVQQNIWTNERNRLTSESQNKLLSISINYPTLRGSPVARTHSRPEQIEPSQWKVILASLKDQTSGARGKNLPRHTSRAISASELQSGFYVAAQWKQGQEFVWYRFKLTSWNEENKCWKCEYDNIPEALENFAEWRRFEPEKCIDFRLNQPPQEYKLSIPQPQNEAQRLALEAQRLAVEKAEAAKEEMRQKRARGRK